MPDDHSAVALVRQAETVVCALIEQRGRVLVARRAPGRLRAGQWEFPGGKVRVGESLETAIVREIGEELGCTVRPVRQIASNAHDYPDITIVLVPFLCELIDGNPRALEHAEIRWVDRDALSSIEWTAADLPIVAAYLEDSGCAKRSR
jgi:8-oxo-dGTP diphosphatase